MKFYYVYILLCSDNSYYTGMTNNLEKRIELHNSKSSKYAYTSSRLPVKLVWYLQCDSPKQAITLEKQIKGWTRRKKCALIEERWDDLVTFSKNYTEFGMDKSPSTGSE